MLISFPFSLSTTISFSGISSLGMMFSSNKAFILCFFFFTQYLLHSVVTVWKLYNSVMKYQHTCVSIKSSHKCEGWRFNLFGSTLLNGQMISCSLTIGCFKCHNLFAWWRSQVRAILLPSYTSPNMLVFEAITYVIYQNMWISLF